MCGGGGGGKVDNCSFLGKRLFSILFLLSGYCVWSPFSSEMMMIILYTHIYFYVNRKLIHLT